MDVSHGLAWLAASVPIDLTRMVGMATFAGGALACALAARAQRPSGRIWWALAGMQALFALEVLAGLRYQAHLLVNVLLREHDWYNGRTPLQLGLLGVALGGTAAITRALASRVDRSIALVLAGTALAWATMLTEAISLHRIDALIYAPLGPVKTIAALWLCAGALVILGAGHALRAGRMAAAPHAFGTPRPG
jgi:hypothetical protein